MVFQQVEEIGDTRLSSGSSVTLPPLRHYNSNIPQRPYSSAGGRTVWRLFVALFFSFRKTTFSRYDGSLFLNKVYPFFVL